MSFLMMAMHCQTMKNEISDTKANKGQVSSKQGSHDLSLVSLMSDPACSLSTPLSLCGSSTNKGNALLRKQYQHGLPLAVSTAFRHL